MRLLIATDSLNHDGAERQLVLTATNLPDSWQVRCFSVGGGPFADYLVERGIDLQVSARRWRFDPLPFLRLWRLIAEWQPDLVHSWGYMTTLAGFPIYRAFGIPFVDGSARTGDVRLLRRWRSRAGSRRASLVVANSRCGLLSTGVSPERGRVIRNGFDFSRIAIEPPPRTDSRFTFVMAARMDAAKDYASFMTASRALAADLGPSAVRFLALGEGPDKDRLRLENTDLVEAGLLAFGYAADVIPLLRVCDCGVLMTSPNRVEGCSNSILEYMACRLPVICSRGGGTDELITHGETGLLVNPGDPSELAQWMEWLFRNREAAKAMGHEAAEKVRLEYSVEAMIQSTQEVYMEALADGSRSGTYRRRMNLES